MGVHGCNADGIHVQCRFCGSGVFADIPCPASEVCSFANEPSIPYYWDPECSMGTLGCMADGMHAECRFCGKRPFEGIPCPGPIEPPQDQCTFPLHGEPTIGYFWDETCESGELLGGRHARGVPLLRQRRLRRDPMPELHGSGLDRRCFGLGGNNGRGGHGRGAVRCGVGEPGLHAGEQPGGRGSRRLHERGRGRREDVSTSAGEDAGKETERAGGDMLLSGAATIAPSLAALASLLGSFAASLVGSM